MVTKFRTTLYANIAVVLGFILIIFSPPVIMLAQEDLKVSVHEKRKLAKFPKIDGSIKSFEKFPENFTRYYDDHFGFRNFLIDANSALFVSTFGIANNGEIISGNDGWLYRGDKVLRRFGGAFAVPIDVLREIRRNLEQKRDWLTQRDVSYLLVVTPLKHDIYPEYLPSWFQRVGPSVTDQILTYLAKNSSVAILDLREAVKVGKQQGPVFDRTDSHWNDIGAYYGYRAIIDHLQKTYTALKPLELAAFEKKLGKSTPGNLSKKLGVVRLAFENPIELIPKEEPCGHRMAIDLTAPKPWTRRQKPFQTTCSRAPSIEVVMLRDSFTNHMVKFLAENFSRISYIWQNAKKHPQSDSFPLMKRIVKTRKPQLVIDQVPARKLLSMQDF